MALTVATDSGGLSNITGELASSGDKSFSLTNPDVALMLLIVGKEYGADVVSGSDNVVYVCGTVGASIMVWPGITAHHRTTLVIVNGTLTARRYVDEILKQHLLPFLREHNDVTIFQQDNVRLHIMQLISVDIFWKPTMCRLWNGCHIHAIEHLWDELGRCLAATRPRPINRQMLAQALQWE